MELDGPVFSQERYIEHRVSEYERILTEIAKKTELILNGEGVSTEDLVKEIAKMANTNQDAELISLLPGSSTSSSNPSSC